MTTETVTIPIYSEVLEETITLVAPEEWHYRIKPLAEFTVYGPLYRRGIVENLLELSRLCSDGYTAVAYDRLLYAEEAARQVKR